MCVTAVLLIVVVVVPGAAAARACKFAAAARAAMPQLSSMPLAMQWSCECSVIVLGAVK